MKRALFLFFLFATCAVSANQPMKVSIINLISTPEKYNGKEVLLDGFLHFKLEDSVLYLSKDHADRLMGKEGVWVDYSSNIELTPKTELGIQHFDGKWVTLVGKFIYEDERGNGHFGLNSGRLDDVSRMWESRQWYDGKEKIER